MQALTCVVCLIGGGLYAKVENIYDFALFFNTYDNRNYVIAFYCFGYYSINFSFR